MKPRIIRSLEERIDLVQEGEDIFWRKNRKRASPKQQKELFTEYNPILAERLKQVQDYEHSEIMRTDLARLCGSDNNQIAHYLYRVAPQLNPGKRKPIPLQKVYTLLADFMPIIEGWQTVSEVSRKLDLNAIAIKKNYCSPGLIENIMFLNRYHISPGGVEKLKKLAEVVSPKVAEWKTSAEVAEVLGVSRSAVGSHAQEEGALAQRWKGTWRFPPEGINYLRDQIRRVEAPFEFCGKTYYPLTQVINETIEKRGIKDPEQTERLAKRIYNFLENHSEAIPFIKESKCYYVPEKTKDILIDIISQNEAIVLLGVKRSVVTRYLSQGILDRILLDRRAWTTYSSVMRLKAEQQA